MDKMVIIGSNGQLAYDLIISMRDDYTLYLFDHKDIAIENTVDLEPLLANLNPKYVINTTAFHNVAQCEEDPQKAFLINSTALKGLAEICNSINATLIHFSTNYVFGKDDRTTPYLETDRPNPVNIYGMSKLSGEYMVRNYCDKYYIFRIAGLYGYKGTNAKKYKNFVEMMIQLGSENTNLPSNNEERFTFTSTRAVAERVKLVIEKNNYGLYHLTCEGESTRFEFSQEIYKHLNIKCALEPVGSDHFQTSYPQPKYSVLANKKLQTLNLQMPNWKESLQLYLNERLVQKDKA